MQTKLLELNELIYLLFLSKIFFAECGGSPTGISSYNGGNIRHLYRPKKCATSMTADWKG